MKPTMPLSFLKKCSKIQPEHSQSHNKSMHGRASLVLKRPSIHDTKLNRRKSQQLFLIFWWRSVRITSIQALLTFKSIWNFSCTNMANWEPSSLLRKIQTLSTLHLSVLTLYYNLYENYRCLAWKLDLSVYFSITARSIKHFLSPVGWLSTIFTGIYRVMIWESAYNVSNECWRDRI